MAQVAAAKVDNPLDLSNGRVDVTGPITQWEDDELQAVFWVLLAQIKGNGTCVTAIGTSGMYQNGASSWQTSLVDPAGPYLSAGPAVAYAGALVLEGAVFKRYRGR